MTDRIPVVGLTGGIASGKSTVAKIWRELGTGVVDADQLSREVVEPGTEGLAQVIELLGGDVLAEDGSLDRKKVAAIVFNDKEALKALNSIVHPLVGKLGAEKLAKLEGPFVVYEAPLLVEVGAHKGMDAVVVVTASEETQQARAASRDNLDADAIQGRIRAQLPVEQKIAVADYVISNNGTIEALAARARDVHKLLELRFGD